MMKRALMFFLVLSGFLFGKVHDGELFVMDHFSSVYGHKIFQMGDMEATCVNGVVYYYMNGSNRAGMGISFNPDTKEPYYCKVDKRVAKTEGGIFFRSETRNVYEIRVGYRPF